MRSLEVHPPSHKCYLSGYKFCAQWILYNHWVTTPNGGPLPLPHATIGWLVDLEVAPISKLDHPYGTIAYGVGVRSLLFLYHTEYKVLCISKPIRKLGSTFLSNSIVLVILSRVTWDLCVLGYFFIRRAINIESIVALFGSTKNTD
jgi:hypothetical protein